MVDANGVNLDQEAMMVLKVITDVDEYPINTSEVKARSGLADNDTVRRRFEKLRDSDLIAMEKGRDRYRNEVWEVEPTPEGEEWAEENLDLLENEGTLEDELLKIRSRVGSLEQELEGLEEAVGSGSSSGGSSGSINIDTDSEVGENVASRLQNLQKDFDTHRGQTKEAIRDIVDEQNSLRVEFDAFLRFFFEAMTAADRDEYEATVDDVREEYLGEGEGEDKDSAEDESGDVDRGSDELSGEGTTGRTGSTGVGSEDPGGGEYDGL